MATHNAPRTRGECRSTEDYIEYAEQAGATVVHEGGKLWRVETDRGAVHLHRNDHTLGKPDRGILDFWMWGLGLVVGGLAFIAWLVN